MTNELPTSLEALKRWMAVRNVDHTIYMPATEGNGERYWVSSGKHWVVNFADSKGMTVVVRDAIPRPTPANASRN